jgi:hypothetical protein
MINNIAAVLVTGVATGFIVTLLTFLVYILCKSFISRTINPQQEIDTEKNEQSLSPDTSSISTDVEGEYLVEVGGDTERSIDWYKEASPIGMVISGEVHRGEIVLVTLPCSKKC